MHGDSSSFDSIIAPFLPTIEKYCRSFSAKKWEREDLVQECLLKIYILLKKEPTSKLTKKYLYFIVRSTWIDQYRKINKIDYVSDTEVELENRKDNKREYDIRVILETLSEYLSLKQFVVVLLTEIFQFTANETAILIKESESNVYTTLHRAKKKIHRYNSLSANDHIKVQKREKAMDKGMFEQFLNGFRNNNPKIIYESYLSIQQMGIEVSAVKNSKNRYCFHLKDPDGNIIIICT
ncbi:sigma-70 family RNA polymerase sigma factor [Sutcliffiella cohnii]